MDGSADAGRNLVVCLDGTGNTVRVSRNSNVLRLFDLLDFSSDRDQVAYYDPGVGTFSALGAWTPVGRRLTRLSGLAFGTGLRQNLGEAYTFLMRTWQPADRIFLFGFSRGAYAARALAGLLHTIGMLHPHEENLVPYAISAYARRWDETPPEAGVPTAASGARDGASVGKVQAKLTARFRSSFARRRGAAEPRAVRVRYLGAWDTVEASGHLRGDLGWPGVMTLPNVDAARHALSIDERRWPYEPVRITSGNPHHAEVWFPGVHSDVGGTFPDPPGGCRLSDITLKWVVDGARDAGLRVDDAQYRTECLMRDGHLEAPINVNALPWRPLSFVRRPFDGDPVHASASARGEYRGRCALTGREPYADQQWREHWPASTS